MKKCANFSSSYLIISKRTVEKGKVFWKNSTGHIFREIFGSFIDVNLWEKK